MTQTNPVIQKDQVGTSVAAALIERLSLFRDGAWEPALRRRTELCLIDSLTCFSSGRHLAHFAPHALVASRLFGSAAANARPSSFFLAYCYGQAANLLDYDDTLIGHPAAPIMGAVLATGASRQLPTDALLRGIAAGYEAHWILSGAAVPSRDRAALVRSVGVWDTLAGALGASVALGLDDKMLERVIGLAASHSLLPSTAKWYERPVPALKNNLGWAAAGAVLSVELAQVGQTGITNVLEGASGMWRMAGSDIWDPDRTAKGSPAVLRVGFKPFPACWHIQLFLTALSGLFRPTDRGEDVAEILVTGPHDVEKFCHAEILSAADIAFSLPATFSLLISGIEPGPAWDIGDDNSEYLRYRKIFRYERSDTRSVALRMRDGTTRHSAVDASDPFDPARWGLDEAGVLAKHQRLAAPALRNAAELAILGDAGRLYEVLEAMVDGAGNNLA